MSSETNKSLIRRWIETGLNTGNFDLVEDFFSPDYVLPGMHGRAALKQALMRMRDAFPDLQVRIEDVIAEGDKVVARCAYRGTHQGMFMGCAPTGKLLHWTGAAIYRIADEKIVEEWAIWDQTFPFQLKAVI